MNERVIALLSLLCCSHAFTISVIKVLVNSASDIRTARSCTVTSTPSGVSCGSDYFACEGQGQFASGSTVQLSVAVSAGYRFYQFQSDCFGAPSTTCALVMDSDKHVQVQLAYGEGCFLEEPPYSSAGTCSTFVPSGMSCSLTCLRAGDVSTAGYCGGNAWSPAPACVPSACSVSLPGSAVGWGSCSSSVNNGASCSFACSVGHFAVPGYCSGGAWTTQPACASGCLGDADCDGGQAATQQICYNDGHALTPETPGHCGAGCHDSYACPSGKECTADHQCADPAVYDTAAVVAYADAHWNCADAACTTRVTSGQGQPNFMCAEFVSRSLAAGGYIPNLGANSPSALYGAYSHGGATYNLLWVSHKEGGGQGLEDLLVALGWQTVSKVSGNVRAGTVIFTNSFGHVVIGVGANIADAHNNAYYHVAPFAYYQIALMYSFPSQGASGASDDSQTVVVPPDWLCAASTYFDGENCECGCGCVDPDCSVGSLPVKNCAVGSSCSAAGECVSAAGSSSTARSSSAGARSSSAGARSSSASARSSSADARSVLAPSGWLCDEKAYFDGETCDCNCGVVDPDCAYGLPVKNCASGIACGPSGECAGTAKSSSQISVPPGWVCAEKTYFDRENCECDCGVVDPDCSYDLPVKNCAPGEACSLGGECISGVAADHLRGILVAIFAAMVILV